MKLYLEKRGCDFWKDDSINKVSNVGNYRVCTPNECIKGRDGKTYFLEFGDYDKRKIRYTNKRSGKPLKNPIVEVVMYHALHLNTQYTNENGSWRNSKLEAEIHKEPMLYTLENILKVVNEISIDEYDEIVFVERK